MIFHLFILFFRLVSDSQIKRFITKQKRMVSPIPPEAPKDSTSVAIWYIMGTVVFVVWLWIKYSDWKEKQKRQEPLVRLSEPQAAST